MLWELCDDAGNTVLIENNSVTPEWVAIHFLVTPLFLMKAVLLMSSQSCRNVDADADPNVLL